ncbi:aldo/keto reductase [Hydrogenimonas sp. SS33]|uniref:aldo/keto reductase n=1 Tax=Hydrogenimonas leucolamina TaxID=2954236 RepID=UPI00336BE0FC
MTPVKLGFGTYRVTPKNPAHVEALGLALEKGVRLIDTSSNYTGGDAERAVAEALKHSSVPREEVTIVTKGGYIQGALLGQVQRGEMEVFDLVPYQEGCWHSIHSDFILDRINGSLQRLESGYIDTYLLHNPEYFLMHTIESEADVPAARKEMERRLLEAFIALEEAVEAGMIRSYGISSNSFAKRPDHLHFLPYTRLLELAEEAAAERGRDRHRFTTIELPVNLLEQEGLKCAAWAKANGLTTLANRPLNAYDEKGMHRLADYPKPEAYESARDALLQAADTYSMSELRSTVLDLDGIREKFTWPGAAEEALSRQTVPFIQGILSRLPDASAKEAVIPLLNPFLRNYLQEVRHLCSQKTLSYLRAKGFKEAARPLQHYALRWLLSRPEIDRVLVGMRTPAYVEELLGS